MWRLLLFCSALWGMVTQSFSYDNHPGPKYTPTKGEVWPRPFQEDKQTTYYTFYPARFQFKITNHNCSILTRALNRCVYALRQLHSIAKRNRRRSGRSRPLLNSARGGPDDDNYLCTLKQLRVNLENPCEEYPSFGMDESYSLNISATSELKSESIWGIIRGLETFTHLFYLTDDYNDVRINTTAIKDKPRYQHRGLLIDTARHYLSVENILKTLDAMAINKMNVLHWHIVDDQSFPYQSRMFPELGEQGAFFPTMIYTQNDVQTVINHARDLGIRVVPEFDVPGHTRSWGNAYPRILTQCYDKNKTIGLGPMDPLSNATYKLLKGLFAEIREVFPDQYLHVGGDEVDMECWESNPKISRYMKAHNITVNQLHALFMQKTLRYIDNRTKVIVWQEVFDGHVPLQPDTLVQAWKDGNAKGTINIVKAGFRALFSGAWYLDRLMDTFIKMYAADPKRMVFEETANATLAALVVGGEACLWGEMADDTNALSRVWPRASAVAEVLWSTDPRSPNAWPDEAPALALQRVEEHACRMRRRGLPAEPPSGPGFCVV